MADHTHIANHNDGDPYPCTPVGPNADGQTLCRVGNAGREVLIGTWAIHPVVRHEVTTTYDSSRPLPFQARCACTWASFWLPECSSVALQTRIHLKWQAIGH